MSRTPNAFVIGWPIDHSRSPLIHGYWLARYGLAGSYERVAVPPGDLDGFISWLRAQKRSTSPLPLPLVGRGQGWGFSPPTELQIEAGGENPHPNPSPQGGGDDGVFVGGNVTIPHKADVAAMCDHLTQRAARLGVVNTIWFEDDRLCGDTTDGEGFLAALDADAPGWTGQRALVLGAGGAAPPVVEALMSRGLTVTIANRSPEKAEALAASLGCEWCPLDAMGGRLPTTDLLVNTTAAGLNGSESVPLDLAALPSHAIVDDIVYVPRVTPLLQAAASRGLRTVGGLGMLLHQAVPGFERWFGVRPEVTSDLRALLEADVDRRT